MANKKIGIFGGGVLGNAMKQYFKEAKIYDKYNDSDSLEEVLASEIIFVCIPTPYTEGKGFGLTEMNDVFGKLASLKDKIVVIRSTVLPGTTQTYQNQHPNLKVLFNPEFLTEATAVEEMVKYMVNNYYALKVIFANQIYDICQAAGLDYEAVKECFAADKRIIDSHLQITHKGYRGFGGKCLRKDVYSLIDFAKDKGVDFALLKTAKEINSKLNDGK